MARLARVVVPGHPHDVTQRGNGRARTFFGDAEYALYRDLVAENCDAAEVEAEPFARLRAAESVGRPLGNNGFLARLERLTRRAPKPGMRGRSRPNQSDVDARYRASGRVKCTGLHPVSETR